MRGGFFTFGVEGGLRARPFAAGPLELEAGCFVGGGGGRSAPQGSGLMLRPHAGAAVLRGPIRFGVEISRVRFPSGGIDSTQAALTLSILQPRLWQPAEPWGPAFTGLVEWVGQGMELEAMRLDHAAKVTSHQDGPQQPFEIAGLSLSHDLPGPGFRFLSVAGAARGASPGYAQALAGFGLRTPPCHAVGLEIRLGAGLGGGGDVDTGGGFLLSGEGSVTAGTADWKASAGLGFVRAPGGQLHTRTVLIRISHHLATPRPAPGGEALVDVDLADWRVGAGLVAYQSAPRLQGRPEGLQLVTLQAARDLGRGFYLHTEAGSATGGGAGGYSAGLLGLGCETTPWKRQRLFTEAALGAGGGGLVRSGGGLLASLRTGWRLDLPRGLGLDATVGRVRAPHGDLDTTTFGMGVHLRFKTLER
jgi:hypothetical protein